MICSIKIEPNWQFYAVVGLFFFKQSIKYEDFGRMDVPTPRPQAWMHQMFLNDVLMFSVPQVFQGFNYNSIIIKKKILKELKNSVSMATCHPAT